MLVESGAKSNPLLISRVLPAFAPASLVGQGRTAYWGLLWQRAQSAPAADPPAGQPTRSGAAPMLRVRTARYGPPGAAQRRDPRRYRPRLRHGKQSHTVTGDGYRRGAVPPRAPG